MYASFYDAAQELNDEDFREYILALKDYALFGIEYTSKTPMVNGLITMAQPLLEAAAKRRAKQVKNGDFGILGGRPRKGETAEMYKARKEILRGKNMGSQCETLNNPMGFHSETLNVDVKVDENEKGNEDLNVKENGDVNPNDDGKNKVNKNANGLMENNSIYTNTISSSEPSKLGLDKTGNGEEPRERRPRQEVVSSHSNETPDRTYPFNYKCGNYVSLDDVEPSDPDWIDCDPNDLPPIIDEGWTPPPPELQHNEVIIPQGKSKISNVEDDKLRQELERMITKSVGTLLDCEDGKKPMHLYNTAFTMATKAIMDLNGCCKLDAEDMIKELKAAFRSEPPVVRPNK